MYLSSFAGTDEGTDCGALWLAFDLSPAHWGHVSCALPQAQGMALGPTGQLYVGTQTATGGYIKVIQLDEHSWLGENDGPGHAPALVNLANYDYFADESTTAGHDDDESPAFFTSTRALIYSKLCSGTCNPRGLAYAAGTSYLYATTAASDDILEIARAGADPTVLTTAPSGSGPAGLAVSPSGATLYVALFSANSILAINLASPATQNVLSNPSAPGSTGATGAALIAAPWGLAWDGCNDSYLYFSNTASSTVSYVPVTDGGFAGAPATFADGSAVMGQIAGLAFDRYDMNSLV
jgi:hypothetical protein